MTYDFDREISRIGTNSAKYDFAAENGKPADVLPLWVADMDFQAPPAVLDALKGTVEHGIFGYSNAKGDYYEAVAGWFKRHFGFETEPDWLVRTPGVVFAFSVAVRCFTLPGDAVLIQPPVYYPFFSAIERNGRTVVENPLVLRGGHYEIDFDDFECKIRENSVKMFILCSPHNPIGRVWTAEELKKMGEICKKYGVFVVSDEIHCDFTLPDHPHTVLLSACPELKDSAIVCTAPSKTFNLAGMQASNIWIPNEENRRLFQTEMDCVGYHNISLFGLVAAKAAYSGGEDWLRECKAYLRANLDYVRGFLAERLPEIKLIEPEGTYFAWLDCTSLGLSDEALDDLIENRAKLWLDAGHIFGTGGSGFQRVVLACTRKTLKEALERLEKAVKTR